MRSTLKRAKQFVIDEPLSPELEITRFISDWMKRYQDYPTFLFTQVRGHPRFKLVMNLLKQPLLMHALEVEHVERPLPMLADRIDAGRAKLPVMQSLATERLQGLEELPVMWHQPGDAGTPLASSSP